MRLAPKCCDQKTGDPLPTPYMLPILHTLKDAQRTVTRVGKGGNHILNYEKL